MPVGGVASYMLSIEFGIVCMLALLAAVTGTLHLWQVQPPVSEAVCFMLG